MLPASDVKPFSEIAISTLFFGRPAGPGPPRRKAAALEGDKRGGQERGTSDYMERILQVLLRR